MTQAFNLSQFANFLNTSGQISLSGSGITGILPVANGGTGTATPSLVAGSGISVTGTFPNQTIAATGGGSGYDQQTFNSSGTWTKPAGAPSTALVYIQAIGGGGGGGRGGNNLTYDVVGGGGGGSYSEIYKQLSALGATETVTIGAGGTGNGSTTTGNAGGTSSLGSHLSAVGGNPGTYNNVTTAPSGWGAISSIYGGGSSASQNSIWGGAGGGSQNVGAGTSVYGGNGGALGGNNGSAGGGGGGGGKANVAAGSGGAGRIVVTVTW